MEVKQGDTRPAFEAEIRDDDGSLLDMSEVTEARFYMERVENASNSLVVNSQATTINRSGSTLIYQFDAGDTALLGEHRAEWVLSFSDGDEETYPNTGFYSISINQPIDRSQAVPDEPDLDIEVEKISAESIVTGQFSAQSASVSGSPTGPNSVTRQADLNGHSGESAAHHDKTTSLADIVDMEAGEVLTGTLSNRSAASTAGRWYFTTDQNGIFYDTGSAWELAVAHPGDISQSDLSFGVLSESDLSSHSGVSDAHHIKTPEYTDEQTRDTVAAFLESSGSVTLSRDDSNNMLTIGADENTDTQLTTEEVQDIVGGFASGEGATTVTYDDANNTLIIDSVDTNTDTTDHTELTNVQSGQHHTKTPEYTNEDARTAVQGGLDVTELSGSLGSDGQIPETNGTSVSWVDPPSGTGGGDDTLVAHEAGEIHDDFSSGSKDPYADVGTNSWTANGVNMVAPSGNNEAIVYDGVPRSRGLYHTSVNFLSGSDTVALAFGYDSSNSGYAAGLASSGNVKIYRLDNGAPTQIRSSSYSVTMDQTYTISVQWTPYNGFIELFIDDPHLSGSPAATTSDANYRSGLAGCFTYASEGCPFQQLRIQGHTTYSVS